MRASLAAFSLLIAPFHELHACAPVSSSHSQAIVQHSSPNTFDGWITFAGEFQLYPKQEDVGRQYDRTCISGYFATKRQQIGAARAYDGKHVRVTGTLIPVAQYWSRTEVGSPVENYCDSASILVARSITILPN